MDDILSMDVSENASSSSSSSSSSACASSSSSDMSWATIQSNENDPNLLEALKVALKLKFEKSLNLSTVLCHPHLDELTAAYQDSQLLNANYPMVTLTDSSAIKDAAPGLVQCRTTCKAFQTPLGLWTLVLGVLTYTASRSSRYLRLISEQPCGTLGVDLVSIDSDPSLHRNGRLGGLGFAYKLRRALEQASKHWVHILFVFFWLFNSISILVFLYCYYLDG